jgi:hypothetical protein
MFDDREAPQNGTEDVVEIVRDPRRKLAYRFELLALQLCRLHGFAACDLGRQSRIRAMERGGTVAHVPFEVDGQVAQFRLPLRDRACPSFAFGKIMAIAGVIRSIRQSQAAPDDWCTTAAGAA